MSVSDWIALVLLLGVPTWALFSSGPVRRARIAVIFWSFVFGAGIGVGLVGAATAFALLALLSIAGARQRMPTEIAVDVRTDLSVPLPTGADGELLVVGSYALPPARVEFGVYRLETGDCVRLEYVIVREGRQLSVWAESFLRSGIWVRSSEALRWEGAPLPCERVHMRDNGAPSIESLVRYHQSNVARYGTNREALDAEGYVRRYAQRYADALRHEEALGLRRSRDGFSHGTSCSFWRTVRLAFDLSPLWRPEQILIGCLPGQ